MATIDAGGFSEYELIIGDTYTDEITYEFPAGSPVDVTGFTAKATARTEYGGTVIFTWTDALEITVGTTDGKFTISVAAAVTAAYPPGEYVWDFVAVDLATAEITLVRSVSFRISPRSTT